MPRKKNYQTPGIVTATNIQGEAPDVGGRDEGARQQAASAEIDLADLLGADGRFGNHLRTIVLSPGLNRGIDEWVFATVDAVRSLLVAGAATSSAVSYKDSMLRFFDYLTSGANSGGLASSRPATPADLKPLHVSQFVAWIKSRGQSEGWAKSSVRGVYQGVKSTLLAMFSLGRITGESHRYFQRRVFGRDGESRITAFSDAEQERLARAIKTDLSAIHHGRLKVTTRELQALRLLVAAHRTGYNTTPLLEPAAVNVVVA